MRRYLAFAATATIITCALWLTYAVYRSPQRIDLSTFGSYAAAVALFAAGVIPVLWQKRRTPEEQLQGVERLADLLAVAVEDQWNRVADGERLREPIEVQWRRASQRLAGPLTAAVRSSQFAPLPGLSAVTEEQLESGCLGDLHAVYGGLGSGRLMIAGGAGSGKSTTAVLLVLSALKYRSEHRRAANRIPVPVLFSVTGWDPAGQLFRDWLANQLRQTYPLLTGRSGARKAARLLASGKLAVILDDLNEMPFNSRSLALTALSEQAAFRLVVLTRTDEEMINIVRTHGPLVGAVALELQPVSAANAVTYLLNAQLDPAPERWADLAEQLLCDNDNPIAKALSNPLNLTLVRETYRDQEALKEFLDYSQVAGRNPDEISDYLLDLVLPAAYAKRLGKPLRYDLRTAEHALRCLARHMQQDELRWWLVCEWVPAIPRGVMSGLAFGTVTGISATLAGGTAFGLSLALTAALTYGVLFGFRAKSSIAAPRLLRHVIRRSSVIHALPASLACGAVLGLGLGLAVGIPAGTPAGIDAGLIFGFAGALAGELYGTLSRSGIEMARSLTPGGSWRSNRWTGIAVGLTGGAIGGLAFGIGFGLAGGYATGFVSGLSAALAAGVAVARRRGWAVTITTVLVSGTGAGLFVGLATGTPPGLPFGLTAGLCGGALLGSLAGLMSTSTWRATLAFSQLFWREHTPVRLIHFLEDARQRKVLRAVGPEYQFRHAKLRERLVNGSQ